MSEKRTLFGRLSTVVVAAIPEKSDPGSLISLSLSLHTEAAGDEGEARKPPKREGGNNGRKEEEEEEEGEEEKKGEDFYPPEVSSSSSFYVATFMANGRVRRRRKGKTV